MIQLYQPPGTWGIPSVSPFCVKLFLWLKLSKQTFAVQLGNPLKAPKKKMPYIQDGNGKFVGDSQLIIEYLGNRLDHWLEPREQAKGRAIRRMLEEGTYWSILQVRWIDDAGFSAYKPVFLKILPPVVGPILLFFIRRQIQKSLYMQGTGRHSKAEIEALGVEDIKAVESLMEGAFMLGDQPCSVDATVAAFLWSIEAFPVDSALKQAVVGSERLMAYLKRVQRLAES
jgi:glutathione S-transferase